MNYWEAIQHQREWSWSLMAICFLVIALFLRHIVLHRVFQKLKSMPRELRKNIQANYTKRSVIGWILFVLAIGFASMLWAKAELLLTLFPSIVWYIIIMILLGTAILCHTQAYLSALLQLVEDKMSSQEREV